MKVLITGGCGFIGSNLIDYLLPRGYELSILDNLSSASDEYARAQNVPVQAGDILDDNALSQSLANVESVVHLAALTSVPDSMADPLSNFRVNVEGTWKVLEACRTAGVTRFVFASSNAAVGEQEPPIREDILPAPKSPYGASKLMGEALVRSYAEAYGIQALSLRFANVFGPHAETKGAVVAAFQRSIKQGKQLTIYGDGEQTRDFVHAADIAQAIELGLQKGGHGQVYQIASGKETSILELAMKILNLHGKNYKEGVCFAEARPGDILRNYSDIGRASAELGYEPKEDLWSFLEESKMQPSGF
ncbi:MAG: NAD-dependent epimerase/dehydratase family protein [Candidatus Omnitrophica bacterium]|nr:NAD-dependent epimerase/dehydratase family protein [Candidatus Omnitrophota bacterium]